jgi:GTP cyclohydrolase II
MMRLALGYSGKLEQMLVERAIAEFRSGRPVLIEDGDERALAVGVEDLDADRAAELTVVAVGHAYLVLPPARLRRLGLDRKQPGALALPAIDAARIEMLALKIDARIDAPVRPVSGLDEDALELARLALVLPAVVVVPVARGVDIDPAVLRVSQRRATSSW